MYSKFFVILYGFLSISSKLCVKIGMISVPSARFTCPRMGRFFRTKTTTLKSGKDGTRASRITSRRSNLFFTTRFYAKTYVFLILSSFSSYNFSIVVRFNFNRIISVVRSHHIVSKFTNIFDTHNHANAFKTNLNQIY